METVYGLSIEYFQAHFFSSFSSCFLCVSTHCLLFLIVVHLHCRYRRRRRRRRNQQHTTVGQQYMLCVCLFSILHFQCSFFAVQVFFSISLTHSLVFFLFLVFIPLAFSLLPTDLASHFRSLCIISVA